MIGIAELDDGRKGDAVVLDSVTYRVADVEKDTGGGRLLKLAVTNPL